MNSTHASHSAPLGRPSRGITNLDVYAAADALLREGQRPTIEKIRERLGRGSPNTINPLLDAWWQTLPLRMESGSSKIFERLPGPVAHAAEALWLLACTEARHRVEVHWRDEGARLKFKESEQAVRTQVLSLREQELKEQLTERDKTISQMQINVQGMTTIFKKEIALRESEARRVAALQEELSKLRQLLSRTTEKKIHPTQRKAKAKSKGKLRTITRSKQKAAKQSRRKTTKRRS